MEVISYDHKNKPYSCENKSDTCIELLHVLKSSLLPEIKFEFDQPLSNDCPSIKQHIIKCQTQMLNALSLLQRTDKSIILPKSVVVHALFLISEHSKSKVWTSSESQIYAEQLLKELLIRSNSSSVLHLLLNFKIDSFLSELRPKLLKNTWKNHPGAVLCFTWILFNIKCPHLGDILHSVLPTCLLLVDDHLHSNKITGLQCLEHVASNVSRTDLEQYGRGTVVYKAIEHMVYSREPDIIPPLGHCLVALLSKTEHQATKNLLWSHFDDVLNIWLPSMEMEQKLDLREAYIDNINGVLQAMGLASVRWSKKLLDIISEYSQQDHTRDKALMILLTFIDGTWPRISSNFNSLVIILMKVFMNVSRKGTLSTKSSDCTIELVKQCLASLETLCYNDYNAFLDGIKNNSEMNVYYKLITENKTSSV